MKDHPDFKERVILDARDQALVRAKELNDLIIHFAPRQPISEFSEWLKELISTAKNHPHNKKIQDLFADALGNSVKMFGERKAFADMFTILDELVFLQQRNFDVESLKEPLSKALSLAIHYLRGSWDIEGTSRLLNHLCRLVREHPKNKVILNHLARGYSSAIGRFCSDRHKFLCEKLLFELRVLANKHHQNADVQYEFAQSITSAIGVFAREGRYDELPFLLEELRGIAQRFPEEERIQLLLTRGTILSSIASNRRTNF